MTITPILRSSIRCPALSVSWLLPTPPEKSPTLPGDSRSHLNSPRRTLALLALLAVPLAGCGGSGGGGGDSGGSTSGSGSGAGGSGSGTINLDVAVFQGGYGIDFFEQAAAEYEQKHPNVKVKVWGNPTVWEQLRPRFIANKPPDLTWPGWKIDYWPLVYEGQVMPLDDALKTPPYDGKGTWKDTFQPALLALGQYQGKQYLMPYFFNTYGWWYNPQLFAQHGWQPPKTFNELLALCDKIKAAGIAPITYQGKYPDYAIDGFLFPWVVSAGGVKALEDAQNLVPGAWKSPAFLQAARMIKELKDRGDFEQGANGLSHTESQADFIRGKAAMIPCGTWLHSEESKVMPPNFQMRFFLPPRLDNGPGDPTAVGIGIEPWIVPTKGQHHDVAIDFYKYMTSLPKAQQFVQEKGTLMSIKGSDNVAIPDYLQGAASAFKASHAIWSSEYVQWYPPLGIDSRNAMSALLNGEVTPEQFVQRLEDSAEKVRNNPQYPHHTVIRL